MSNWSMRLQQVQVCKAEFGHCHVPATTRYTANPSQARALGFDSQRSNYRAVLSGREAKCHDKRAHAYANKNLIAIEAVVGGCLS